MCPYNFVPTILRFVVLLCSLSAALLLALNELVQLKLHCWVKNFPFVGFFAAILVQREGTCASHVGKGKIQAQKGLPTVHTCLPPNLSFCLFVFLRFLSFCLLIFLFFLSCNLFCIFLSFFAHTGQQI